MRQPSDSDQRLKGITIPQPNIRITHGMPIKFPPLPPSLFSTEEIERILETEKKPPKAKITADKTSINVTDFTPEVRDYIFTYFRKNPLNPPTDGILWKQPLGTPHGIVEAKIIYAETQDIICISVELSTTEPLDLKDDRNQHFLEIITPEIQRIVDTLMQKFA